MIRYSDFTVNFTIHPIKGDITAVENAASVTQAIKNLVFTNRYERPFDPMRGAGVPATLFENMEADSEFLLETRIREAIERDEPRAIDIVVRVITEDDRNGYSATIFYTPINTTDRIEIDALFRKVR